MIDDLLHILTVSAALGCGLIAGVFFAFSSFVMKALARLPPPVGLAAMQSINVVVLNRSFLGLFLGTAVACVVLAASALLWWGEPAAIYRLAGSALYLAGSLGVTGAFHVPRNVALATADPDGADGASRWAKYVGPWTVANHVRAAAALGAAALFTIA